MRAHSAKRRISGSSPGQGTRKRNVRSAWPAITMTIVGAMMLAACGGDDAETASDSASSVTPAPAGASTIAADVASSTSPDTAPPESQTTSPDTSETTGGDAQTTTSGSVETTLPGQEFDGFPDAGDMLAVMGVAHDDSLNVRSAPGNDEPVTAMVAGTAENLVATGRARLLPNSIWYEVTVDGETGWVGSSFVAFVGPVDDFTAEFVDGGDPPTTETLVDLAELVAAEVASEDPKSKVVQSVSPSVGDLGEITYDVIGLGDDSVAGYRLHIFAVEKDGGESFALRTIERMTFCARGLSGERCA